MAMAMTTTIPNQGPGRALPASPMTVSFATLGGGARGSPRTARVGPTTRGSGIAHDRVSRRKYSRF
jgi:hypothetical protein